MGLKEDKKSKLKTASSTKKRKDVSKEIENAVKTEAEITSTSNPEDSDSEKRESSKKRKNADSDEEELEIDVNAPEPLSKKQKRLLKKGKINEQKESTAEKPAPKRSDYGVWIGNLSFETDKDELRRFLILKSKDKENPITDEDITRVNLPRKQGGKPSGFAYVDFAKPEHVSTAVELSEQNLNGRNLLIKDAKSYEGRPAKVDSKNPPSRILFVGNLSFETTEDELTQHFQHCGEIMRIRMATFEDTGKCKGFAFIDFREIEAATAALTDKRCRKLLGRDLRMEYGEDRSKRKPKSASESTVEEGEAPAEPAAPPAPRPEKRGPRPTASGSGSSNKRRTPGAALATAQRAKSAIVASTGKKITFD